MHLRRVCVLKSNESLCGSIHLLVESEFLLNILILISSQAALRS